MEVLIDIPTKEFGVDIADNFQDFFKRLEIETKSRLVSETTLLCGAYELETIEMFLNAFKEMQIIPDNVTNGDVIKAMFPNVEIHQSGGYTNCLFQPSVMLEDTKSEWWNAPYKGVENGSN